jgi:hypothetical protein
MVLNVAIILSKILTKLRSYDEKLEKEEKKTMGKSRRKKPFWQSDKDSGLDENDNNSASDEFGNGTFHDRSMFDVILRDDW